MTVVLAVHLELDDHPSHSLRTWRVWHIILYILTAVFGIANSAFLFQIESLVADRCIFFPKELAFRWVELPNATRNKNFAQYSNHSNDHTGFIPIDYDFKQTEEFHDFSILRTNEGLYFSSDTETPEDGNVTIVLTDLLEDGNGTDSSDATNMSDHKHLTTWVKTHSLMLYTDRSVFQSDTAPTCQFAEYMPLLSATFAIVWATLFIMCPSGGRAKGLHQPWRILTPALVFGLVMVALTGVSFLSTNSGLTEFCSAFISKTNTTACTPVNKYLERSWNSTFTFGSKVSATRAASAAVWTCWMIICALLLARCLTAPDFVLKRTAVKLVKDPAQKVTPYLLKNGSKRRLHSANGSPSKRDNISVKSEPTNTTELVTVSLEHEADSEPSSLVTTPLRERPGEGIEMTYNPQEYRYKST